MDTTARQVTARIGTVRGLIAAEQSRLASLTALRDEMRTSRAHTVGDLSEDARARHQEAIQATAGRTGGVEMW